MDEHRPKRTTNSFALYVFLLTTLAVCVVNAVKEPDQLVVETFVLEKPRIDFTQKLTFFNLFKEIHNLIITEAVNDVKHVTLDVPIIPEHIAQNVSYLKLTKNKIYNIVDGYFSNFTNLKILKLSYNLLCSIPASFRTHIPAETIYLDHNGILGVERTSFNPNQTIRILNLDFNDVRQLHFGENLIRARISVKNNKDLRCVDDGVFGEAKYIDISNTMIDRFNFLDVKERPEKITLLAKGNKNIKCDCDLMKLMVGVNPVFREIEAECVWDEKEPPYKLAENTAGEKYGRDALKLRWEQHGCLGVAPPPNKTAEFCGLPHVHVCKTLLS